MLCWWGVCQVVSLTSPLVEVQAVVVRKHLLNWPSCSAHILPYRAARSGLPESNLSSADPKQGCLVTPTHQLRAGRTRSGHVASCVALTGCWECRALVAHAEKLAAVAAVRDLENQQLAEAQAQADRECWTPLRACIISAGQACQQQASPALVGPKQNPLQSDTVSGDVGDPQRPTAVLRKFTPDSRSHVSVVVCSFSCLIVAYAW